VGLHNRRSFELYIVSDEEDMAAEIKSTRGTSNAALLRCVSRDASSPTPASILNSMKAVTAVSDSSTCGSVSGKSNDWHTGLETPKLEVRTLSAEEMHGNKRAAGIGDGAASSSSVAEVTPCASKNLTSLELSASRSLMLCKEGNGNVVTGMRSGDNAMSAVIERSHLMLPGSSRQKDKSAVGMMTMKKRDRKLPLTPDLELQQSTS
jgi:hypothetical protein